MERPCLWFWKQVMITWDKEILTWLSLWISCNNSMYPTFHTLQGWTWEGAITWVGTVLEVRSFPYNLPKSSLSVLSFSTKNQVRLPTEELCLRSATTSQMSSLVGAARPQTLPTSPPSTQPPPVPSTLRPPPPPFAAPPKIARLMGQIIVEGKCSNPVTAWAKRRRRYCRLRSRDLSSILTIHTTKMVGQDHHVVWTSLQYNDWMEGLSSFREESVWYFWTGSVTEIWLNVLTDIDILQNQLEIELKARLKNFLFSFFV